MSNNLISIGEVKVEITTGRDCKMTFISMDAFLSLVDIAKSEVEPTLEYETVYVTDDYFEESIRLYKSGTEEEIPVSDVFKTIDQIYVSPFSDDEYIILWLNEKE